MNVLRLWVAALDFQPLLSVPFAATVHYSGVVNTPPRMSFSGKRPEDDDDEIPMRRQESMRNTSNARDLTILN
jgi:hypothetical protein